MTQDVTRAAIQAVGAIPDDNFVLHPDKHAGDLPVEAGALARVLRSQPVRDVIAGYNASDTAAIGHQASYKRLGRLSLRATLVSAVLGGVALALMQNGEPIGPGALAAQIGPALQGQTELTWALGVNALMYAVLLAQFAAITVAFTAAEVLRRQKLFDRWNEQRGLAELHRRELFEAVTGAREPVRPSELALLPLQLEYFRRFQLDVQAAYYLRRGEAHREAAEGDKGLTGQFWRVMNFPGTPLAVFAGAMALLLLLTFSSTAIGVVLTILGLMGVAGTGLTTYFNGLSALNQDRLNAARYAIAGKNLEFLRASRLEEVRVRAAAGDSAAVCKFVEDVNAQISTEHREWYLLHDKQAQPGLHVARPVL